MVSGVNFRACVLDNVDWETQEQCRCIPFSCHLVKRTSLLFSYLLCIHFMKGFPKCNIRYVVMNSLYSFDFSGFILSLYSPNFVKTTAIKVK